LITVRGPRTTNKIRDAEHRVATEKETMFLARVEGSVVSTKKEASMNGRKLLLLRPQLVDEKDPTKFRPGSNTIVAVDTVGAGINELVMFCQGSSARLAAGLKDAPVDAVVIGIVDSVDVFGKQIFSGKAT
jgi:ethanolamine utilization protein EutN